MHHRKMVLILEQLEGNYFRHLFQHNHVFLQQNVCNDYCSTKEPDKLLSLPYHRSFDKQHKLEVYRRQRSAYNRVYTSGVVFVQ